MATASMSYLQTLAKDEAIAFVASLQTVKDHLSQALLWLETQVQQKTVQLQGIETLLAEAAALGLVAAESHPTAEAHAVVTTSVLPAVTTSAAMSAIAASPVKEASTQRRGQQGKAGQSKASSDSKSLAAIKTNTAKGKQLKPSTPPARKVNQRGKASSLQPFFAFV